MRLTVPHFDRAAACIVDIGVCVGRWHVVCYIIVITGRGGVGGEERIYKGPRNAAQQGLLRVRGNAWRGGDCGGVAEEDVGSKAGEVT